MTGNNKETMRKKTTGKGSKETMKRKILAAIIMALVISLCLAITAQADGDPENHISLVPHFEVHEDPNTPDVLLWASEYFEVHTDLVRNCGVQFFWDEDAGPEMVWLDDNGYGEAWFTPGPSDAGDIFNLEGKYDAEHMIHYYDAFVRVADHMGNPYEDEDGNLIVDGDGNCFESSRVSYKSGLLSAEDPGFLPVVTNVSGNTLRQDGVFAATVSNNNDFDTVCIVFFEKENDEAGNPVFAVDSHWITIDHEQEATNIEVPLLKLKVNQEYNVRLYGLKNGYPMSFDIGFDRTIRVISPASSGDIDTEIRIGNMKNSYETGESILPTVYYPACGLDDVFMEISIFAVQNADEPWAWDYDREIEPDEDGSIYHQPETWDDPPSCWSTGDYIYRVSIWHDEGEGQRVALDSTERAFTVTGDPFNYDPGLPAYINRSELPYALDFVRPDADMYFVRIENGDDHDWEADPDYDPLIIEFNNWSDPAGLDNPEPIIIGDNVSQRVRIYIDAGKAGYDWYHFETNIPVVSLNGNFSLWTDEGLADEGETIAAPLPVNFSFPVRVQAPGADWIRLENIYGEFYWTDNREEIDSRNPIERGESIHEPGVNFILATAQFTDEQGEVREEQKLLILHGEVLGVAGPFTASLDKDSASRGETVTVTYTRSEYANHYWVDLEVWNPDWNDWQGYEHLADLYIDGENNGGTAVLNTMRLEPNSYRVCARAEAEGYYAAEYEITDSFTVRDTALSTGEIQAVVSKDSVETNEEFTLTVFAPGANHLEAYWNGGDDDWNWRNDCGGDNAEWDCAYGHSGQYQILVRAWYPEFDENGEQVWQINEETGEIHVDSEGNPDWPQEYYIDETVTMNVTAPHGAITLTIPEGIPTTLTETEYPPLVEFTIERPANAEWLSVDIGIENTDTGEHYDIEDGENELKVQFYPEAIEAGQEMRISIHAGARGYENADVELSVPVIKDDTASDLVVLHRSETDAVTEAEDGTLWVTMGGHIEFLVSAAEGHTLTAVKFYGSHGWWEGGEEINHENHKDWFQDDDNTAFFNEDFWNEDRVGMGIPVYAMARIDGEDTWLCSDVQTYYQMDYQIGRYDFVNEDTVTAARGEDAVFAFTEAQNAEEYWVDAWDVNDDEYSYNPQTTWGSEGEGENRTAVVTLNTIQLPEGEYIIRGRAGAEGKGWRESDSEVHLVVTEGDAMEGEAILTIGKTEALTMEKINATFIAPGADWVEIIRRHEDGWEDDFARNENGDGTEGSFDEDFVHTVEVFGRAHFFARDEEGNMIPDDEDPECVEELPWLESSHEMVTITAPYGRIEQNVSGIPVSAVAGQSLNLHMNMPDDAVNMGWQLYLNRDFDDDEQEPDYDGNESFDLNIDGSKLVAGNTIELRVWLDGVGYEHNHQNYLIPVLEGTENRVALEVSSDDVLVRENFTVTVTAPYSDRIRYDNGNGMWMEWNDDLQEDVPQEMDLDENHQWIHQQDYDNPGIQTLYAWALIDNEWVRSDPVRVTVTRVGYTGEPILSPGTVTATRGELVTLTYTEAEHAN